MVAKKKKKVAATKKTAKGGGESEAGEVEALYLVAEGNEEAALLARRKLQLGAALLGAGGMACYYRW